jgi:hypothetical protein
VSATDATEPESRTSLLSRIGLRGWWTEHAATCAAGCQLAAGPARACDVGEALFRLAAKEIVRGGS